MTSNFYVKLLLGIIVGVIAAIVFVAVVARADYPNGFAEIHAICARSPEVQPGIKGVELAIKDDKDDGVMILLFAGEGETGIGVGVALLNAEGVPFYYTAIYHMTDGSTVIVDLLTREQDTVTPETVQKFISWWLGGYSRTQV